MSVEDALRALACIATGVTVALAVCIEAVLRLRERNLNEQWFGERELDISAHGIDVAFIIGEVSARLRAGATVEAAWSQSLLARGLTTGEFNEDGIPSTILTHPDFATTARALSAGCRMTRETGIALADILDTVLHSIEDATAATDARRVARAGPELTARMLTVLPVFGIGVAIAFGASLVDAFVATPIGRAVGLTGLVLWVGGYLWIRRIVATVAREDINRVDPLVVVDLVRAALNAGASIPRALDAVSAASGDERLAAVSRALILGAGAIELKGYAGRYCGSIVEALYAAWTSGASPVPLLELAAQTIRNDRATAAKEVAEQLAIRLTVPLGLCLLPAFVCLGIFPVGILFFGY